MFQAFKQVPSTSCTTPFWFKAASLLQGHGSVLHSSFSCITAFSKSSVYWYFAERFLSSIRKTCSTTLCLLSICPKIKQPEKCLKSVGIPRQQVFSLTSELLSLIRAAHYQLCSVRCKPNTSSEIDPIWRFVSVS